MPGGTTCRATLTSLSHPNAGRAIVTKRRSEPGTFDRRALEVCVFVHLADALQCAAADRQPAKGEQSAKRIDRKGAPSQHKHDGNGGGSGDNCQILVRLMAADKNEHDRICEERGVIPEGQHMASAVLRDRTHHAEIADEQPGGK